MLLELRPQRSLIQFNRQQLRFRSIEKLPRQIAVVKPSLIVNPSKLETIAYHESIREIIPSDTELPPIRTLAARLGVDKIQDELMLAAVSRPSWTRGRHTSKAGTSNPSSPISETTASPASTSASSLPSPSLSPTKRQTSPLIDLNTVKDNESLAMLGDAIIRNFAFQHLFSLYPYLPGKALQETVESRVGDLTCAKLSLEWGANYHARWRPTATAEKTRGRSRGTKKRKSLTELDRLEEASALASIPRAIAAILHKQIGQSAAHDFIRLHFFTDRKVDMRDILKFAKPKAELKKVCGAFKREAPSFRMLAESGRFSKTPLFIVGAHSGEVKLGEGFGISIKMAEHRAAANALQNLYLSKAQDRIQ